MKKADLLRALEVVKPGLANKEIVEQATSFAFIDGSVVTYNDEISISYPVPGLSINGAIRAEELYQFLKRVKIEDIELEMTESEIIMKAGRSKAGLIRHAEIKLPLEALTVKKTWLPLPEHFVKAIGMTVGVCSRDTTQPKINSVHVSAKGYVEGTDNYRAMRHKIGKLPVKTFLIPVDSARELLKLDLTDIAEGNGWAFFRAKDGTVISCRVFEDDFPNVDRALQVTGTEITFPNDVKDILERAEVFSKKFNISDDTVEITLKNKRIMFSSEGDAGWFKESVETEYKGEQLSFMINPTYFKNILNETKSGVFNKSLLKFQGVNWEYAVMLKA